MKNIRTEIFETNSSSSHTLTIRRSDDNALNIPENAVLDICEEVPFLSSQSIVSEIQKLRYVVQLIAVYMDEQSDDGVFGESYYNYWGSKADEGWKKFKDVILNFPWLVWLSEVVKEERNTTLVFDKKRTSPPYITQCDSFEDDYVWSVLGLDRDNKDDKKAVKELFRELIFNPNVILEDNTEEY